MAGLPSGSDFRSTQSERSRELSVQCLSPVAQRRLMGAVLASVLLTAALYALPFGRTLSYPLMLVSTLAHELGHGLMAWLLGGDFVRLEIFADGSGLATHRSTTTLASALVAAGGLVGPAVAASSELKPSN